MEVKTTLLDRKLLYELDKNARASLSQLAKRLNASRERIHYRMNRLERLGVITEYRTIINANRLGYTSFRVYMRLRNATVTQEREIIHYLKQHKQVNWIVSVEGIWNINTWIIVKEAAELGEFLRELEQRYQHFIADMKISFFYDIDHLTKAFLIGKKENDDESEPFISPAPYTPHDDTDLRIIHAISRNARLPLMAIAERAGLSPKQTRARIREIERKKIIIGYRANINFMKMGYTYFKLHIMLKDCTEEWIRRINSYARRHPNAIYINKMLNGADIELEFMTEGKSHMRAIVHEFRNRFAEQIASYELLEYPVVHKLVYLPGEDGSD